MDDLPAKLGGYVVERELGRGGMGVVYLARDPRLHRQVAIKALNEELGEHPDRLARFEREARTLAAINNANIAAVYGLEEDLGRQLLVMEYVPGRHLGEHVRALGALPPEDAAAICVQIAAGLEGAHEIGVVHRDLKPANVRVRPDGVVKVLDFGLAKPEQEIQKAFGDDAETMSVAPTADGRIMGTAGYMSPEQARGRSVDKRADIWAFGAVLFECLAGHRAFRGETPMDALVAILEKEPPWELLPDRTPARVRELIRRCLEKDPRKRLRDIGDARIDLEAVLHGPRPFDPRRSMVMLGPGAGVLPPGAGPGSGSGSGLRGSVDRGERSNAGMTFGSGTRSRFPSTLTSFVGRDEDLDSLRGLLGEARLLTLAGPGGSGKSRLALECARRLDGEFADGCWCVDVSACGEADAVAGEIASAFGVVEADASRVMDLLIETLSGRDVLLVLDNCEEVRAGAAEVVSPLLAACPGVRVIATSREALGVDGEWVYRVGMLRVPDRRATEVEEIAACESVRLFVDRARAVKPEFVLDARSAEAVAEICRQLDGVPLALELAAARMKLLGPGRIAERLGDRFKLLRSRTGDPRQQTLLAAIEWSFEQLDETERAAMRRLSVFRNGSTLGAAEAVLPVEFGGDGPAIEDWEVLDVLEQLVDKSMVTVVEPGGRGPAAETRYRLLESIRQYGAERLRETDEQTAARRAMAGWCARFATRAEGQLVGRDQREWFERVEQEHENVRAALEFVFEHGEGDAELVETGRVIAAGVWRFWAHFGHLAEGRRLLLRLDKLGAGGTPTAAWARLRQGIASMATVAGDLGQAVAFAVAGLDMARASEDQKTIGSLLECLGAACLGDLLTPRAMDHYEESREVRRGLGDRVMLSVSVCGMAACARAMGDIERAARLYDDAADVLRGAGDGLQMAALLAGRGRLALASKDAEAAFAHLKRAGGLQVEMGAMTEVPATVEALACVATLRGQHEKAIRLFAAAEAGRTRLACPARRLDEEDNGPLKSESLASLDVVEASRAWEEGEAMSLRRAMRYGVGD